jgi:hypothetical protein
VYGNTDNGGGNGWPQLSGTQTGPTDRTTNIIQGAAGYITQFPSGETVVSCNTSNRFSLKIGDSKGREFNNGWSNNWLRPFPRSGWWGAVELDSSHALIGTIHGRPTSGTLTSDSSDGIQAARFILNHRIDAPSASISVDGDNSDWIHTDALFIGSESPAQTVFRAACDAQNLYILAEQLSTSAVTGNSMQLYLHNGNSIRIRLNTSGLINAAKLSGGTWTVQAIPGLNVVCTVSQNTGNVDAGFGFLAEIAIPLSVFTGTGDFNFNAVTKNGAIEDSFTFAKIDDTATWLPIRRNN